ncbi:Serine/threonine-protein kinase HT1 [Hordeum vulgare]|nr:Serine/threonine-protein kinase HT1 [Hordeum vulgare]
MIHRASDWFQVPSPDACWLDLIRSWRCRRRRLTRDHGGGGVPSAGDDGSDGGETWLPVKTEPTADDGGFLRRYLDEGFVLSDDGGIAVSFLSREHRLWSSAGRRRQKVERLRPARSFGGDVRSCLADRCYALSCLVGRCYARQILPSLRVWMDERREGVPLGAVVASTDCRTDKDYADLYPEDGSTVR